MAVKIYLFDNEVDCIGSGCLSLEYVRYQLEAAGGQDVEFILSSAGGSHFDALAIYDLAKNYQGIVDTVNVSLAGSAAATIFAAGKKRKMSKYALLMIHPASVTASGDSRSLTADAEMLEKVTSKIIAIWTDVTGQSEEKIAELVNATTWLTAEEALALGFITEIEEYAEEIKNAEVVANRVSGAPEKARKVINQILKPENKNDMNKELIEKNNSLLTKVMNFFKKSTKKMVTNVGEKFIVGALATGAQVFNDADLEETSEDVENLEITNDAGKVMVLSIKDGKVSNLEEKEKEEPANEDEDKDDDTEAENKVVLNTFKIKVTNKTDRKTVINAIAGKLRAVSAESDAKDVLILDLRNQLKVAHAQNQLTETEVKNKIITEFAPDNSKRSHKGLPETAKVPDFLKPKEGSLAANAVKASLKNVK